MAELKSIFVDRDGRGELSSQDQDREFLEALAGFSKSLDNLLEYADNRRETHYRGYLYYPLILKYVDIF